LGSLFKDAELIDSSTARLIVDGISITRITGKEYDSVQRRDRERHHYVFAKDAATPVPGVPWWG
jgi:hypothetical protein